jgi:hypothetical protein
MVVVRLGRLESQFAAESQALAAVLVLALLQVLLNALLEVAG